MAYFPKQGDIIKMSFDPTKGNEQQGNRPAVVVSHDTYHKFSRGSAMVCPITNKDRGIPLHKILDNRTKTSGVIMTDQVKTLDLTQRNALFVEKLPTDILYEVCDIVSGFTEIEEVDGDVVKVRILIDESKIDKLEKLEQLEKNLENTKINAIIKMLLYDEPLEKIMDYTESTEQEVKAIQQKIEKSG